MFTAIATAMAINFTTYPVFINPEATIEALTDKGLIVEMIVNCPQGVGIVTYSKVDKKFCTPDFYCTTSGREAVARLCR